MNEQPELELEEVVKIEKELTNEERCQQLLERMNALLQYLQDKKLARKSG